MKQERAVTFDGAPAPGTINFGVGQPSADLLPVDLLRRAAGDFLDAAQAQELNYGERQGDVGFRQALAEFLTTGYRHPVAADSLFVSGGSSQALDFICAQFARPGELIYIEEPSYFLAHRIFADHRLQAVGIPVDQNGLRIDALEAELTRSHPALLYTIPAFHNPGGQSLNAERRRKLVELSARHDFVVLADEVYQLLHYSAEPPPALGTMIDAGNVLSLGSFSKIMAPGLRLGWIQAAEPLMVKLLGCGVVNSGGSLNHFASQVQRHALELGLQQQHLERLRAVYARRVEAM
ncbi:MAG: PLP-dependent aminotransferase family protein, partial [Xanthomonadales bacterium]|nr:PLP-dependent aminotransferase family protein [Xanthomonadales bacterium]